jgi:hypothetical protein
MRQNVGDLKLEHHYLVAHVAQSRLQGRLRRTNQPMAHDVECPAKLTVENLARAAHPVARPSAAESLPANERYGDEELIKG